MSGPRSPLSRVDAAQLEVQRAQEGCPHWDFDSDGCGQDCCDRLEAAERELHLALAARRAAA